MTEDVNPYEEMDIEEPVDAGAEVHAPLSEDVSVGVQAQQIENAAREARLQEQENTLEEVIENEPALHSAIGAEPEEDFSSYADLSGFDVMTTEPSGAPASSAIAPPDRTDVMAPVRGRTAYEYRAPKAEKDYLSKPIKIVLSLAAILLLAAGIGLLAQEETRALIQQRIAEASKSSSETPEEAPVLNATSSDSSIVASTGVSDARAIVDDDTAFEILTATYDKLQSYNDRVYTCLQTYNGTIVSPDRAQREAAAGIASSLLDEIEKDMKTLDAMNIGRASDLYDDYQNIHHLLDDQFKRLAVVVESWDISLSYDNPYQHQTEILEPLTRDIGPTGQNIYLEDFDANYWNARPVRS